jgi:hypothetical protein
LVHKSHVFVQSSYANVTLTLTSIKGYSLENVITEYRYTENTINHSMGMSITYLYICIFVEEANKCLHNMKYKINTAQQTLIVANFGTDSTNL